MAITADCDTPVLHPLVNCLSSLGSHILQLGISFYINLSFVFIWEVNPSEQKSSTYPSTHFSGLWQFSLLLRVTLYLLPSRCKGIRESEAVPGIKFTSPSSSSNALCPLRILFFNRVKRNSLWGHSIFVFACLFQRSCLSKITPRYFTSPESGRTIPPILEGKDHLVSSWKPMSKAPTVNKINAALYISTHRFDVSIDSWGNHMILISLRR